MKDLDMLKSRKAELENVLIALQSELQNTMKKINMTQGGIAVINEIIVYQSSDGLKGENDKGEKGDAQKKNTNNKHSKMVKQQANVCDSNQKVKHSRE